MTTEPVFPPSDDKLGQILETAQRRFGLYGYEKTTMQEIAGDLGISKPLLYYYFADKSKLFRAVVEKEQEEFLRVMDQRVHEQESPADMMFEFISVRIHYFRKFINLTKLRMDTFHSIKPIVHELHEEIKAKEVQLVREIIERGISQNQFDVDAPEATTFLFLDILQMLRWKLLHKRELLTLTEEDESQMRCMMNQFAKIFIRGISHPAAQPMSLSKSL